MDPSNGPTPPCAMWISLTVAQIHDVGIRQIADKLVESDEGNANNKKQTTVCPGRTNQTYTKYTRVNQETACIIDIRVCYESLY